MKKFLSSVLISFVLLINLLIPVSVLAVDPTITLTLTSKKQDPITKNWSWEFTLKTKDAPDNSFVDSLVYEADFKTINSNQEDLTPLPNKLENKLKNNSLVDIVENLKDNTIYTVQYLVNTGNGDNSVSSSSYYECKTGKDSTGCSVVNLGSAKSDGAVPITPKINETGNKSVYNLLAPIMGINKMDTNGSNTSCINDPSCIPNNIGKYLNIIFKLGIGLCAALAVIMLIINGITYMGDESIFKKTEAKSKMFSAIFGLIIALGAWALLNTINPDLTGVNGLKISAAQITISPEDTSTGSSTSLCLPSTPPDPNSATGGTLTLNSTMTGLYIPTINTLSLSAGIKLLITAQAAFEGFSDKPSPGTKSYRTNNPGNIGNVDSGGTVTYKTLTEGIQAQQKIITNIANNAAKSYKTGGTSVCALGTETYEGYLYQYLRIYATGARTSNAYLNSIIGYFKANGKVITPKTTIFEIYNMK